MTNLIAFHRMGWILKNRGLSGHPIGDFLFGAYAGFRAFVDAFRNLANNLLLGARTGFRHWRLHQRNPVGRPESWAQIEDTRAIAPQNLQPTMRHPTFYKQWRESNGHALRQNFDQLFAVSDLANTTVAKFLPPGSEIETLPLPIDVELSDEERQKLDRLREAKDGMTLSFFGYDIASKGLPFLIDALSQIDDPFYANSVDLLIVSRLTPHRDRQLRLLEGRFRTVRVVPGYSRRQLPSLAAQIDLNIVPSIWRETFNQTTVELARLGVPSLVSSHVGAKQTLPHHDRFVFAAEDAMDFGKQLDQLVRDKSRRDSFFETALDMPSIADHVDRLMYHYGKGQPSGAG